VTEATKLPRRFYKTATVVERDGGFGVALDERTLKTPGGAAFVARTEALAQLCADEWAAQGEYIAPITMPVSQLAFAALDRKSRDELYDYVLPFGETDLLCHRAEGPVELVARQAQVWDPIVAWSREELGVALPVVSGIIAARVAREDLAKLRAHAEALDEFRLTALSQATGLAGSVLIGFGLVRGRFSAEQAFEAAALDNLWSLEKWGEDEEGRARLERQRRDFAAIARFVGALG
jgi:chaperone required for assembly of F1-ATPase